MFEYILLILSFVVTMIALFGDTWDNTRSGINKLTIKGKISLIVSSIILIISIHNEYYKQKENDLANFEAHQLIAIHSWELEMQIEKIEQMDYNSKKLNYLKYKLHLLSKQLERVIEIYKSSFKQNEIQSIENLILYLENEQLKLDLNTPHSEINTSLTELTLNARKIRKEFCDQIINESSFCEERQKVSGVNFWDRKDDTNMNLAINHAKNTFKQVLKNFNKLEENSLSIKVPLPLFDETYEHVWLNHVSYNNGYLSGIIDNDITGKTNLKKGDYIIQIMPNSISDWQIIDNNFTYGNFTLFVALNRMDLLEKKDFVKNYKHILPSSPQIYKFRD